MEELLKEVIHIARVAGKKAQNAFEHPIQSKQLPKKISLWSPT